MQTIETCPLCLGRGTRRRSAGIYRPGHTHPRDQCAAYHGSGGIERRRLCQIVRTTQTSSAARESARYIAVDVHREMANRVG
jgi:hypothetical protein